MEVRKPPLGITPRIFWLERRLVEVHDAIIRYSDEGFDIPANWWTEYNNLVTEIQTIKLVDHMRECKK